VCIAVQPGTPLLLVHCCCQQQALAGVQALGPAWLPPDTVCLPACLPACLRSPAMCFTSASSARRRRRRPTKKGRACCQGTMARSTPLASMRAGPSCICGQQARRRVGKNGKADVS
jgi:hypothetical protein